VAVDKECAYQGYKSAFANIPAIVVSAGPALNKMYTF